MKTARIEYIDGARGIAALSVVISHFIGAYGLPIKLAFLNYSILHIFWHGEGAVEFFFILSGFVLSLQYFIDTKNIEAMNFLIYAIKRFFRIFPAFIFVLILSYILNSQFLKSYDTFPSQTNWIKAFWRENLSISYLLKQMILVVQIPSVFHKRLIPIDWTLTIEFVLSLLIPFWVLICKKNKIWFILFTYISVFALINTYCINFALGILLADSLSFLKTEWNKKKLIIKILILSIAILCSCHSFLFEKNVFFELLSKFKINLNTLGAALLLLIIVCSVRVQKILSVSILKFLGEISYAVYVSHMLVLIIFTPLCIHILNTYFNITDPYTTRILAILATILTTITLSLLIQRFIEKPFVILSKKLL